MKKYLFCLMVGITLVVACSNEDADGGCYENWSSENKPAWLQDKVNDIVRKESGSSSYYLQLIMSAYSYKYKNNIYVAVQYAGILGDKVVQNIEYYTSTGAKVTSEKVRKAYDNSESVLLWTNRLGDKELKITGVMLGGVGNPTWLQAEIERLSDKKILNIGIYSIEYGSNTYVAVKHLILNEKNEIESRVVYYSDGGDCIETSDMVFQELDKLFNHGTNLNLLWNVFLEYNSSYCP